jgi:RHS repeat-associated protein
LLGNGVDEYNVYNNRMQLTRRTAIKGTTTLLDLQLGYFSGNNGNVASQSISHGQISTPGQPDYEPALNLVQSYGYDPLNRIASFTEGGISQSYDHDRWGNHWVASSAGYQLSSLTPTGASWYEAATNRLNLGPGAYDGRGNQKSSVQFTLDYDGENLVKSASNGTTGTVYVYDGNGRRVKKTVGAVTTLYVYDAFGRLAAEYGGTPPAAGGAEYLTADHLGSTRLITTAAGGVKYRYDYLPYGEGLDGAHNGRSGKYSIGATLASADGETLKFTSKERDAETGLDYFGARYMSSAQGRFTSPDPLLNSGRPWEPQSWNRYAYVLNNPLRYIDPLGLYEWGSCDGTQKECDSYKKQFRSALDNLKQARDSYDKKSREYKRLDAALSAYGKEGQKNGVSVGFGALAGGTAGTTTPLGDLKSFAVTLDPAKWSKDITNSSKFLASDVGHEGTHVNDLREVFAGNEISPFSLEYRGYESSAFAFHGLFKPALSASPSSSFGGQKSTNLLYGGSIIWNSSWGAADKAAIQSRDVGITNAVKSVYGHAETTPHNPWGN